MATIRYVSKIEMTHSRAARPGVLSASTDSSFTVRAVSQPQKAKIDPDRPAMKAERPRPAGLNQSRLKEIPVGESPDLAKAAIAKTNSTTSWKSTSTIWTRSVVVIPR